MEASERTHRNARRLILAGLVAAGVILRLAQYLHNREFWADEAYLAVDVMNMSYCELAGLLHYNMTFPLGFLFAIKFTTSLFGNSEYAFRLLSLLVSIISVFLFAGLIVRLLQQPAKDESRDSGIWLTVLIAVALFASGKHLIYYSSELRHYPLDIAAACALYLIALPVPGTGGWTRADSRRMIVLGLTGAVIVWFSLTSVFILAAIATVQFVLGVMKRERPRMLSTVVGAAIWGVSFCIHLYLLHEIMALDDRTASIRAHVASMSVPIPPTSLIDLQLWLEYLLHAFYFPGGMTYSVLAALVFLLGCVVLWKRNRTHVLLLSLPLAYMLFATAVHQYPSRNQYLLFLMPWITISLAAGISFFFARPGYLTRLAGIILLLLLVVRPGMQGAGVLFAYRSGPGDDSVIKPLLAYAKENWRDGDMLLIDEGQAPMTAYYAPRLGYAKENAPTTGNDAIAYVLPSGHKGAETQDNPTPGRCWSLSSLPNNTPRTALGQQIEEVRSPSAILRLYESSSYTKSQLPFKMDENRN